MMTFCSPLSFKYCDCCTNYIRYFTNKTTGKFDNLFEFITKNGNKYQVELTLSFTNLDDISCDSKRVYHVNRCRKKAQILPINVYFRR